MAEGLDAAALGCGGLRASVLYQRCSAGDVVGMGMGFNHVAEFYLPDANCIRFGNACAIDMGWQSREK